MQKQENKFAATVNIGLPGSIWFEKTSNPFRAGMPDFYYEGPKSILWVEYKWLNKPFNDNCVAEKICTTRSWNLQRLWLNRAHLNSVNTAVIIGVGTKQGYILKYPYCYHKDQDILYSVSNIQEWIISNVT